MNPWALVFFSLLLASPAQAHPLDLAVLNLSASGKQIDARLEMNPGIAAQLLKIDLNDLPSKLSANSSALYQLTLGESKLSLAQTPCTWNGTNPISVTIENPQLLIVHAQATCAFESGAFSLELPYLRKLIPTYRLMYMAKINGNENVGDADPARPEIEFALTRVEPSLGRFIGMGIEHIGVAPNQWSDSRGIHLPYGMDHILFVFALMLSCASVLELFKTVTGFTLGHTISLALASFGFIQVSGRYIEALIALTIAYVAAQSIFKTHIRHTWKVTIGIGMVHGLGFAAALADLNLRPLKLVEAVLGFNVGVELGQAAIVVLFFYLIQRLRKQGGLGIWALRGMSFLIFLAATKWFIERAFPGVI